MYDQYMKLNVGKMYDEATFTHFARGNIVNSYYMGLVEINMDVILQAKLHKMHLEHHN